MAKAKKNLLKDAAYTPVYGITRDEAEEKGYAIVEYSFADGTPVPVYGYYNDTQSGGPLDVTAPIAADTQIVAGGTLGAEPTTAGNKGSLVNPNDPVVHGTDDNNPHEDGGTPNASDNSDLKVEGYDPAKAGK